MTTRERALALAEAAARFPELCPPSADEMMAAIQGELGHEEALEGFQKYHGGFTQAIPARTILHIVSGNTPHAALQTMLRGLLLGSRNFVKFPSNGLGALEEFSSFLPAELAALLECSREIRPGWKEQAEAWVVFGDDRTVAMLRAECPAGRIFEGHGHRVSFAVVFDDPEFQSCAGAARDVSLFDQAGCMSPHGIYVAGDALGYASRLAVEMEACHVAVPARPLSMGDRVRIAEARDALAFEAANSPGTRIWQSSGLPGWTVVYEEDTKFRVSPLDRFVFVKPLPADISSVLGEIRHVVGGIGIFPASLEHAEKTVGLGASRICPIGKMQETPFTWHADSRQNLAALVRWVDFEPDV